MSILNRRSRPATAAAAVAAQPAPQHTGEFFRLHGLLDSLRVTEQIHMYYEDEARAERAKLEKAGIESSLDDEITRQQRMSALDIAKSSAQRALSGVQNDIGKLERDLAGHRLVRARLERQRAERRALVVPLEEAEPVLTDAAKQLEMLVESMGRRVPDAVRGCHDAAAIIRGQLQRIEELNAVVAELDHQLAMCGEEAA